VCRGSVEESFGVWTDGFFLVTGDSDRCRVVGELDLASAPALRDHLAEMDGDIELDCSGVSFIDCSGLSALVDAQRTCQAAGVRLVLVDPSRCVTRLVDLAGLSGFFHVRDSIER
jgi:anti-sigma B factor antagonist